MPLYTCPGGKTREQSKLVTLEHEKMKKQKAVVNDHTTSDTIYKEIICNTYIQSYQTGKHKITV